MSGCQDGGSVFPTGDGDGSADTGFTLAMVGTGWRVTGANTTFAPCRINALRSLELYVLRAKRKVREQSAESQG